MLAAESAMGRHQVEIRRVSGKIWRPFFSIWVAKPIYTLAGTPTSWWSVHGMNSGMPLRLWLPWWGNP